MAIVLCRIDDRLIHGQVVIGWGRAMGIDLIILVDDQVAASDWEQELYRMAVTPEIEVRFVTMADAARQMPEWQVQRQAWVGADRRPGDHGRSARRPTPTWCSESIWAESTTGPAAVSACRSSI